MIPLRILADDLSGAADCAASCIDAGLSALVRLRPSETDVTADVVAFDLDTRTFTPADARRATACAARAAFAANASMLLYKKIDSTLRGNVGAEIAGCLDAAPPGTIAIVAPAFPATGRTTRSGIVHVHGTPLGQSEIWHRSGMCGPSLPRDMLEAQGLRTGLVGIDAVRGGVAKLAELLQREGEGRDGLVCDAECDADLAAIAKAALSLPRRPVLVGSGGLAREVAVTLAGAAAKAQDAPLVLARPVLIAVGSMSSVSREQAQRLAAIPSIAAFTLSTATLLAPDATGVRDDIGARIHEAVTRGDDVLLAIAPEVTVNLGDGPALAQALARLAARALASVDALIATGGETARALLCERGADTLRLVREIEPGVVLSVAATAPPLAVVTKAGGFGTPDSLLAAWRALRRMYAPGGERGLPGR